MRDEDEVPSEFLAGGSLGSAIRRLRGDLVGTQIGVYKVTGLLGVGGMGEVYCARDTKLARDVAIKVLPPDFLSNPERLARLRHEARVLASLNHPNIAAIYGLDESIGTPALVLELVEGQTLADLLAKGPLPIADALTYARQIAEAVEAAHEKGIIHRDLKPSNIKITPNRVAKVLDFGLAKASTPGGGDSGAASIATRDGVMVGTVAYMSPEQVRGQVVDKRSDIWAFGCVFYEMLTGRAAFQQKTTSDTIAGILNREPDRTALPAKTPEAVRRLLSRCLEKDSTLRLRDIGDAWLEIKGAIAVPDTSREQRFDGRRGAMWVAGSLLLIVSIAGAVIWMMRSTRSPKVDAIRFSFVPPEMPNGFGQSISPDGRMIALAGKASSDGTMLFVRPVDSVELRPLPGTEGAISRVFWSPDSRYMGFWSGTSEQLKVVGLSGGPPRVLADVKGAFAGGTWNSEDIIVFSNQGSLYRVPARGGTVTPLQNRPPGERAWWPQFLPDGRRYLYLAADEASKRAIIVRSLASDEVTQVMQNDSRTIHAPPNFLLFMRQKTLLAQKFDASRLTLTGEPTVVAQGVFQARNGNAAFSVSDQGTLIYRADNKTSQRSLVWFDRTGSSTSPTRHTWSTSDSAPMWIELSPDAQRVAFSEGDSGGPEDVWIYDLERNMKTPLTTHPMTDHMPVWSPDGSRVAFDSARGEAGDHVMLERRADAATPEQLLLPPEPGTRYTVLDWTADFIIFSKLKPGPKVDIWAQRLSGDRSPFRYLQNLPDETNAALSPDGRWLAYVSKQAGAAQVIVQSFPDPTQRREQVSRNGGGFPRWRRDGRELFYLNHDSKIVAVPVEADGTFAVVKSQELFTAPGLPLPGNPASHPYDVTSDGQRFLFSVLSGGLNPTAPITVVVNWTATLSRAPK